MPGGEAPIREAARAVSLARDAEALAAVIRTLLPLDVDERERVLGSAARFFGLWVKTKE